MISEELLKILCCPATKADLVLEGDSLISTDASTRYRYRIENDIPIMLVEEAEQLEVSEWEAVMQRHGIIKSGL